MPIQTELPLLETILGERQQEIGVQFLPYKNHVYRVLNFCLALHDCQGDDQEKLVIAGCFHDLGIWPQDEVDYLQPSIDLARQYLSATGRAEWTPEISRMIDLHHKFRRVRDDASPLVEVFRRGDWVDASLGLRRFGLPRELVRRVRQTFPNLGFHRNLIRLTWLQLRRDPLRPLPMMRW